MAAPLFYNQGDQNIYKDFQFVPQEKYRTGFTAPVQGGGQDASTPSFGIPNTNAFTNSGGGGGGGIKTLTPYSNSNSMSAPINSAAFQDPLNQKIADQMRTQNPNLQSRTNEEIIESNPDMFDIKTNRGFYQNTVDNLKNMGSLVASKFSKFPGVGQGKSFINNIMDNTMVGRFAAMRNPLNPNASNYNRALQGQIDYLKDMSIDGKMMIGKDPGSYLDKYGPDSVLSGQNVVSGFGTNDYGKQLQNKIDKLNSIKTRGFNTIFGKKSTDFSVSQQELLDKAKTELAALEEEDEKNYQDRIDNFVKSYSRPGVKAMFDKVYDGKNIHGGPTDSPPGKDYKEYGSGAADGSGGYNEGDGGSYSGASTEDYGGGEKDGGFIDGTNRRPFNSGGRTGYFFGGRVSFKNGGLASIL